MQFSERIQVPTRKACTPACRHRGIRVGARLLAPTGLALWLALDAVSAQQWPPERFEGEVVQGRQADPEMQTKIDEAFRVFGELLAVSQSAAAPDSHWRVTLTSWRDAQAAWEHAAATLPASVEGLKRCALPLQKARGLIEQVHRLFLRARDNFGSRAVELLLEHEELRKQAEGPLEEAEECYRAAWNTYSP